MGEIRKNINENAHTAAFKKVGKLDGARGLARGSRKVLLVLTGSPDDSKSFTYAMNVAQRIEAGLEIMFFAGRKFDGRIMKRFKGLLEKGDVGFHFTRVSGCMKTKILEYTTERSNIQFVVAESLDALNNECQQEDRSLRGALKDLRCPLVLVSEMETT